MPGDSGVTVVTTLVCFFHFAREAAGASGARHSLRPLISGGGKFNAKLGASRREIGGVVFDENCVHTRALSSPATGSRP